MKGQWFADVTNDPTRDFDLCIEITKADEHWGTISRAESGELVLRVYPSESSFQIPAKWLAGIITAADTDLPGNIK